MKKLFLILFAFLGLSNLQKTTAQGWTGNVSGVNETVRAIDMAGSGTNPNLRVAIGLATGVTPTAQLHTTGNVRFAGIAQDNAYTRVMVLNTTTGDVRWRDAATIGNANNDWLLTGNNNTTAVNNILGTLNNFPVRFFTNNTNRATLNNNGFFVHPNNVPTPFADGTALGSYGKIRTQLLGNFVGADFQGISVANMDNMNGNDLGTTGIVENRHGDSYFRGYWGVIIDKYGGGANFTAGLSDATYTNGNDALPEPGCFAIRTRIADAVLAGGDGDGVADDFRNDFIVRNNGRVGIATINPNAAWMLDVNGAAGGTQNWIVSDKRFKKNVATIDNALELVRRLDGVYYDYDHERNPQYNLPKERSAGFLAQDLEQVFPVAVTTKSDGFKAVNYDAVIPLLTQALKEQDERINRLEAQLEDARAQLDQRADGQAPVREESSELYQNVPNPSRDATVIRYKLAQRDAGNASICIFDLSGRLIRKFERIAAGEGTLDLPVKDLQPGMYLYALIANEREIATRKMIVE